MKTYETEIAERAEKGTLRALHGLSERDGHHVSLDGRRLLNLSSNDYLGLATDLSLRDAFLSDKRIARFLEMGSSSSRLLTGNLPPYALLEKEIALQYGREKAALVFNSGYHANVGILPALAAKDDLILADKLCHASLIDGMRLSNATHLRYRHLDMEHLHTLLAKHRSSHERAFIVSESIFSMDGDQADLQQLVALRNEFDAFLYIDEAHAVGVRGKRGLGLCEESGLLSEVDIILGTFGKALASQGAFAVSTPLLRQYMVNTVRSLIYTTALPPLTVAWNLHVFRHSLEQTEARTHLSVLARQFGAALRGREKPVSPATHIIPYVIGSSRSATDAAQRLQDHGVLAFPIRPPPVPPGTSRLRFSLISAMTWQELQPIPGILASCNHIG